MPQRASAALVAQHVLRDGSLATHRAIKNSVPASWVGGPVLDLATVHQPRVATPRPDHGSLGGIEPPNCRLAPSPPCRPREGTGRASGALRMEDLGMIPSTRNRVPAHTAPALNDRIQRAISDRVSALSGHPELIKQRLQQLDREWDIERAIEMNASALAFVGTSLGATINKRWLALPALVTAFLFQHAVQGWCPPVPILRRLGFRTVYEIEQERRQLLARKPRRDLVKRGSGRRVSSNRRKAA